MHINIYIYRERESERERERKRERERRYGQGLLKATRQGLLDVPAHIRVSAFDMLADTLNPVE